LEKAEEYYNKLVKIFDETSLSSFLWNYALYLFSGATFFSYKGQWKEANQHYEEALGIYGKLGGSDAYNAGLRKSYCWALLQQGRFADAKAQFLKAKEIMTILEKRFEHSNVLGHFVAPINVEVGKEFHMRLDVVNVGKNPGLLIKVEGLAPADFKVTTTQPHYDMQGGSLEFKKKSIDPFSDLAIVFTVQVMNTGNFKLDPQLIYVDDLGETKTCKINSIDVTVHPVSG
jgi:hypothetical protein